MRREDKSTLLVLFSIFAASVVYAFGPGTLWADRPRTFDKAVNYARDDIASARISGGDR